MAATFAEKGLKAFNGSKYTEAVRLYSEAISLNPNAVDYYLKRSTSHQRSANYPSALDDAEVAVKLAHTRGKRELIGQAQLRRGIALHLLKRYGDANFCFNEAERRCGEKDKNTLGIWKKKVELALQALPEDDIQREVTIEEVPIVQIPLPSDGSIEKLKNNQASAAAIPTSAPAEVTTPVGKIRHEWYQTTTDVVLTLYVKGVPKDKAVIEIQEKSVSISFPLSPGNDFVFDVDPLFDRIIASESGYKIMSTKVELKLRKAIASRKWAGLEEIPTAVAAHPDIVTDKPVYPTSSKKGTKDWDAVARDLSTKDSRDVGGAGDADNDADDSDAGGDPVNHFFKKLYKDADDDTRRAMMKSYVESNGTALSTNWKEVGQGKVETSPPEGMVAKPWNE